MDAGMLPDRESKLKQPASATIRGGAASPACPVAVRRYPLSSILYPRVFRLRQAGCDDGGVEGGEGRRDQWDGGRAAGATPPAWATDPVKPPAGDAGMGTVRRRVGIAGECTGAAGDDEIPVPDTADCLLCTTLHGGAECGPRPNGVTARAHLRKLRPADWES